MPRKGSPYGPKYQQARKKVLGRPCQLRLVCNGAPATSADHVPPLSRHRHVEGSGCCRLQPACAPCQNRQLAELSNETKRGRAVVVDDVLQLEEPDGIAVDDPVWRVPWLTDLLEVPPEAEWPRFMSAPHPRAVGSLGVEFEEWCRSQRQVELRWFQRLVARRLLEVDADGRLVWRTLIFSVARQMGKSLFLRLLLAWRLHQGRRFGGPQNILHTSIEVGQVAEVMGPEIDRARQMPTMYDALNNHGDTSIELLEDGSIWKRVSKGNSRSGAGYGKSAVSLAVVDEAWSIPATTVNDGLWPTLLAGVQPQLFLVSTAHRRATALMLDRRMAALDDLRTCERGALILEWSTPRWFPLDDVDGWRMASPWWDLQREEQLRDACHLALNGVAGQDPDEEDPVESFRSQFLNQWPVKMLARGRGEPLLDLERWASLAVDGDPPLALWVGVSDNFGRGAGVAAVAELDNGRFEVDAWTCEDRDEAFRSAAQTLEAHDVPGELVTDPSLASESPDASRSVPADVRFGLTLVRQLVLSGRLVHDVSTELDEQIADCRVRPVSNGLVVVSAARSDLVRALALALRVAVVRVPTPAIHVPSLDKERRRAV